MQSIIRDTIYQDSLERFLERLYQASDLVFLAKVDSTVTYQSPMRIAEGLLILSSSNSVFISIKKYFKGGVGWPLILSVGNKMISSTSCDYGYSSINGWTFLNFSKKLDSLNELSIYLARACRPAGGFRVIGQEIIIEKYPGVSVSLSRFEELTQKTMNIDLRHNLSKHPINKVRRILTNIQGREINPTLMRPLPQAFYYPTTMY